MAPDALPLHRPLASAPSEAYTASHPDRLLLTDVVMPGGTGPDLARRLTAVRPGLKILFISGYPEHGSSANGSVLDAGVPFLQKPFTRDLLLEKVREILG
jgi:FixJ family two-component response regulator